ncbi:hypothetical protein SOCE26_011170 [Sorangium cellulosum]|uniref:Serine protease n=1 Tax=Sorangium cellulosum TaxID=56 RepID=A0A2L0EKB2_SORCE|nr:trypsin-like peptidase domain-containing protein [Sorangium cellulosum]AUX39722.1 hypothetical protein SOCE26_011170 [Sorangium cellulosum]
MTWDGPALVNLADVLADLYPEKDESRIAVKAVGLKAGMIKFSDAAVLNWFNILSYANNQDQVLDIVDFALQAYPKNQALRLAKERETIPAVKGPDIRTATWRGPSAGDLEKLVSGEEDTLVDVCFLEIGFQRANAVARIVLPSGSCGSGFLIRGGLLVTNHHVLPDADAARAAEVQFNYQRTPDGLTAAPVPFRLAPERFYRTSDAMNGDDWTVVAILGEPEGRYAPLDLADVEIKTGDRVNIIQHPMGLQKQMSFFHNRVVFVSRDRVQYLTDTQPGSSGAPVFDKQWRVVALHHSGGMLREPGVKNSHASYRNEGIHINAVIRGIASA